MKKYVMALSFMSTILVMGANIQWDCIQLRVGTADSIGIWWRSGRYFLDLICDFSVDSQTGKWQFSTIGCGMEFVGGVYESSYGMIVDETSVGSADVFFAYNDEGVSSKIQTPVVGVTSADIYMSVFLVGMDESIIYGWIEFSINDGIDITDSAIDLDGGPMIVGGGAYSIPEPSGGLLFILGAAALGLRRRIGRGDCPRFGPMSKDLDDRYVYCRKGTVGDRPVFHIGARGHDSGNPCFMLFGSERALLFCAHHRQPAYANAPDGPNLALYAGEIQNAIDTLSGDKGMNRYQLNYIDFSAYQKLKYGTNNTNE